MALPVVQGVGGAEAESAAGRTTWREYHATDGLLPALTAQAQAAVAMMDFVQNKLIMMLFIVNVILVLQHLTPGEAAALE